MNGFQEKSPALATEALRKQITPDSLTSQISESVSFFALIGRKSSIGLMQAANSSPLDNLMHYLRSNDSEAKEIMKTNFAILVPVGGGLRELSRLERLLDSILLHEPFVSCIVIIDDTNGIYEQHAKHRPRSPCEIIVLEKPRRDYGFGHLGGLFSSVLFGLEWIYANTVVSFVLKLDADAYVVAPFADELQLQFSLDSSLGQIGTIGRTCNRDDLTYGREDSLVSPLVKTRATLLQAKNVRTNGNNLFVIPTEPRSNDALLYFDHIIRSIDRAIVNGYHLMNYCQGGAYALSRNLLQKFYEAGHFRDIFSWSLIPVGEDVIMSMCVYSVGMNVSDYSQAHQAFGLSWNGLPFTPNVMKEKGFSIIHSMKCETLDEECYLYSLFS